MLRQHNLRPFRHHTGQLNLSLLRQLLIRVRQRNSNRILNLTPVGKGQVLGNMRLRGCLNLRSHRGLPDHLLDCRVLHHVAVRRDVGVVVLIHKRFYWL